MPRAEIPPSQRPMIWRKVNARLAVLGRTKKWLSDSIFAHGPDTPTKERHYHAVTVDRWLRLTARMPAASRRQIEDILFLRRGDLLDEAPIAVVVSVPGGFEPDQDLDPAPFDAEDERSLELAHNLAPIESAIVDAEDELVRTASLRSKDRQELADLLGVRLESVGRMLARAGL